MMITGNKFADVGKNAGNRIAYFLILMEICDVESGLCDQKGRLF